MLAGPDRRLNGKAAGQRFKLNEYQRQTITRMTENGPIPAVHGVARWSRRSLLRSMKQARQAALAESCPSDRANGHTGIDQRNLILFITGSDFCCRVGQIRL